MERETGFEPATYLLDSTQFFVNKKAQF
jgi:hypothetical protein